MTAPTSTPTDASRYDLTPLISPHLDLHMLFPLLEYIDSLISSNSISYSSQDVAQARLSLLKPTRMVDYAMDIYKEVHGEGADIPREMEEQKEKVFQELEELRAGAGKVDELFRNEELRVSSFVICRNMVPVHIICAHLANILELYNCYTGQSNPKQQLEHQTPNFRSHPRNHTRVHLYILQIRQIQF